MNREKEGFKIRKKQDDHYSKDKDAHEVIDQEDLEKYIDNVEKAWNKIRRETWIRNKKFKEKYNREEGGYDHTISSEKGE